jgi:hypothetical protein
LARCRYSALAVADGLVCCRCSALAVADGLVCSAKKNARVLLRARFF